MSGKSYNVTEEQVRLEVQKQMHQKTNYADLTSQVAQSLRRDDARKQRILARSPHLAYALDATELAQASSRELAARELKEVGIDCGDNDPVALLDAHHAGRQFARDGGKRPAGMDGADESAAARLLRRVLGE